VPIQPISQPVPVVAQPISQPTPVVAQPISQPAVPVAVAVKQTSEITWPMLNAAWSELLAFTERRTDAARGAETFDRIWRESCIALAERYPELDPFFADVKYANGNLIVTSPNAHLLEALLAAYQRSLASLGIPVQALEALVQPIRARHQAAWAATGLEALWRR
jgi:hypothetical protein